MSSPDGASSGNPDGSVSVDTNEPKVNSNHVAKSKNSGSNIKTKSHVQLLWRKSDVKTIFGKHRMFPSWVGAVIDPNNPNKGYMPVALWHEQAAKLQTKSDGFYKKIQADSAKGVGNIKGLTNLVNRGANKEDRNSSNEKVDGDALDDSSNKRRREWSEESDSDSADGNSSAKRHRAPPSDKDNNSSDSQPLFIGSLFRSLSNIVRSISDSFFGLFSGGSSSPTVNQSHVNIEQRCENSMDEDETNDFDINDLNIKVNSTVEVETPNSNDNYVEDNTDSISIINDTLLLKNGKINPKPMRNLAFNSISSSYSILTAAKDEVVVGPGDNYGGDFTVYEGDHGPLSNHASMTIRVAYNDLISLSDFISFTRVQNQVAKSSIYIFPNKQRIIYGAEVNGSILGNDPSKYEKFDESCLNSLHESQSKLVSLLKMKGFEVSVNKGRRSIEDRLEHITQSKKSVFDDSSDRGEVDIGVGSLSATLGISDSSTISPSSSTNISYSNNYNIALNSSEESFSSKLTKLAQDSFHKMNANDLKIAFNFKDVSLRG